MSHGREVCLFAYIFSQFSSVLVFPFLLFPIFLGTSSVGYVWFTLYDFFSLVVYSLLFLPCLILLDEKFGKTTLSKIRIFSYFLSSVP